MPSTPSQLRVPWALDPSDRPISWVVQPTTHALASILVGMGDLDLRLYPNVARRLNEQTAAIPDPPRACQHLLAAGSHVQYRDGGGIFACLQHPPMGLICFTCMDTHSDGHDQTEEFRCDECGRQAPAGPRLGQPGGRPKMVAGRIWPVVIPIEGQQLRVTDPAGRPRMIKGPAQVQGLGVCEPCRARAANTDLVHLIPNQIPLLEPGGTRYLVDRRQYQTWRQHRNPLVDDAHSHAGQLPHRHMHRPGRRHLHPDPEPER
jgi:hypothetical protein